MKGGIRCKFCSNVVPNDKKIGSCSRCNSVLYCSAKCQKDDWDSHRHSCLATKFDSPETNFIVAFDLDHTLIHASETASEVEQNDPSVHKMVVEGRTYYVSLRPKIRKYILQKLHKHKAYYTPMVYTSGTEEYAAKLLSIMKKESGVDIFNGRVIGRNPSLPANVEAKKTLHSIKKLLRKTNVPFVSDNDIASRLIIFDDRMNAWESGLHPNVVRVKPYKFFRVGCPPHPLFPEMGLLMEHNEPKTLEPRRRQSDVQLKHVWKIIQNVTKHKQRYAVAVAHIIRKLFQGKLAGCVIMFSGIYRQDVDLNSQMMHKLVLHMGAKTARNPVQDVTHVVCIDPTREKVVRMQQIKKSVKILHIGWLLDSITYMDKQNEDSYTFESYDEYDKRMKLESQPSETIKPKFQESITATSKKIAVEKNVNKTEKSKQVIDGVVKRKPAEKDMNRSIAVKPRKPTAVVKPKAVKKGLSANMLQKIEMYAARPTPSTSFQARKTGVAKPQSRLEQLKKQRLQQQAKKKKSKIKGGYDGGKKTQDDVVSQRIKNNLVQRKSKDNVVSQKVKNNLVHQSVQEQMLSQKLHSNLLRQISQNSVASQHKESNLVRQQSQNSIASQNMQSNKKNLVQSTQDQMLSQKLHSNLLRQISQNSMASQNKQNNLVRQRSQNSMASQNMQSNNKNLVQKTQDQMLSQKLHSNLVRQISQNSMASQNKQSNLVRQPSQNSMAPLTLQNGVVPPNLPSQGVQYSAVPPTMPNTIASLNMGGNIVRQQDSLMSQGLQNNGLNYGVQGTTMPENIRRNSLNQGTADKQMNTFVQPNGTLGAKTLSRLSVNTLHGNNTVQLPAQYLPNKDLTLNWSPIDGKLNKVPLTQSTANPIYDSNSKYSGLKLPSRNPVTLNKPSTQQTRDPGFGSNLSLDKSVKNSVIDLVLEQNNEKGIGLIPALSTNAMADDNNLALGQQHPIHSNHLNRLYMEPKVQQRNTLKANQSSQIQHIEDATLKRKLTKQQQLTHQVSPLVPTNKKRKVLDFFTRVSKEDTIQDASSSFSMLFDSASKQSDKKSKYFPSQPENRPIQKSKYNTMSLKRAHISSPAKDGYRKTVLNDVIDLT